MLQEASREPFGPIFLNLGANLAAKPSSGSPSECCPQVYGKASSSTAKQRFCKHALGRPLARMRQVDKTTY